MKEASRLTFEAMKLFRHLITVALIAETSVASVGQQLTADAKCVVDQAPNAELQLLQGTWEGVLVGDKANQKVTITITGDSLRFHRDTDFWFETTITVPAGRDPKQLHATITGCPSSQADSIGQVVRTCFKIEAGTLTLATIGDDAEQTPTAFEGAGTRYELRKVQPREKTTEPNKTR